LSANVWKKKLKIFAIHGAFSTPAIFNYARTKIKSHQWQMFDYSDDINDFQQVCGRAIEAVTEPCHVIGHSMGGMIGLYLAGHWNVKSVTTIASPLDGLDVSMAQQYISRSSFIRELRRNGNFIHDLQRQAYLMPVQHIITTRGFNPYMFEENDGVVSLSSQRGWSAGEIHEIAANHAEIMQHDDCIKLIKKFISAC
jgi:triacylglycerol esterase/lipase EstA (alpha/beta hydrolase family)